jgi:mannose-6-phosphate isomerase-like protein (cupin superfamily)
MPMIHSADAPHFELPDVAFTGLAAPSRGSRENAVWRVRVAPGNEPTIHRLTREEILVAIAGRARVTLEGAEHEIAAGGAVVVPANTDFALFNPYDAPFDAVAVLPVGGQAIVGEEPPFTPPWAE